MSGTGGRGTSEYEAAYFTLLRARDEHAALLRYRGWLEEEAERLESFVADTRSRSEEVPRRLRRPVSDTQRPMLEAVGRRRATVLAELDRMDDRIAAAAAFVEECEREVDTLRG